MNLKELKEKLNSLPPEFDNYPVILQKDAEGNYYSPLCDVESNSIYIPESSYSGTVYSKSFDADEVCMDETEWSFLKNDKDKQCIVLWPVN